MGSWSRSDPPSYIPASQNDQRSHDEQGWWLHKSYTDTNGNARNKDELLVAINGISTGAIPVRGAGGGSGLPADATFLNVLADLDFIAGTYTVNGTSYAITDLFEPSILGSGAQQGPSFVPATYLIANRGLKVSDADNLSLRAKTPLKEVMSASHTGFFEFEDVEMWHGSFLTGVQDAAHSRNTPLYIWQTSGETILQIDFNQEVTGSVNESFRWSGLNRIAYNIGTAADNIALNGDMDMASFPNNEAFFTTFPIDQLQPFGSQYASANANSLIRRMVIMSPQADTKLSEYSTIYAPGPITDLTVAGVGSNSVTFAFSDVANATSYEYLILPTGAGSSPSWSTLNNWQTLPANKTVSGFNPSSQYWAYIRTVGVRGLGSGDTNWGTTFTTTA